MTPERWKKVEDLFHRSFEMPPEERGPFLDDACDGDTELRDEVLSLLKEADQTGTLMGTVISQAARSLPENDTASFIGRRIGPYRITRLIGQGGMAEVYCAVRDDEQYQKQVAIKLIRGSAAAHFLLNRFRHERQILASLEHPCIARFLEGGSTEDGTPYFVMEYIEGEPVTAYCERRRAPVRERLELFRSVCDAVQYAHRNLIVHRDLKPSNILVTPEGVPKLLDFGIAKLLNPDTDSGEPRNVQTVTSFRIMTPEYASPEQVRGEPATTATDIYSLGAVLFELLTGRLPHRLKSRSMAEIERAICESEPERPSSVVLKERPTAEGRRMSRELARELDNIVMMAMQKEPQRRYRTADQLARDVDYYLQGRPISARTPTLRYRAAKMLRRHKFAAAAAVLFLLLAVLFVGGIVRERNHAEEARAHAEREAARARAVNEFLQSTLGSADPFGEMGREVTLIEALQASAGKIQESFKSEPEIEADVRDTIGHTFLRLGHYEEAEKHLQRALDVREDIYGPNHEDVAHTINNLATLYQEKGDLQRAEEYFRKGLAIRKQVFQTDCAQIASSLNDLAVLLRDEGKIDEAEKLHREALAMRRKVLGPEHEEVATSLNNLASILYSKGDLAEAESMFREVLQMDRKRWGEEHPNVGVSMNNLAFVLQREGNFGEAEALYRKLLDMNTRLLGKEHPLTATSLNNLGGVLLSEGHLEDAEQVFRKCLEIRRRILPAGHPHLAITLNNLGQALQRQDQCGQAEPYFREALTILSGSDFDPARSISVKSHLGGCLITAGRLSEAESLLAGAASDCAALKNSKECAEVQDQSDRLRAMRARTAS